MPRINRYSRELTKEELTGGGLADEAHEGAAAAMALEADAVRARLAADESKLRRRWVLYSMQGIHTFIHTFLFFCLCLVLFV